MSTTIDYETKRQLADIQSKIASLEQEHLTGAEVDRLIDAAKANRWGHRASSITRSGDWTPRWNAGDPQGPLRAAGAHDQGDRDARDGDVLLVLLSPRSLSERFGAGHGRSIPF